ncbi:putative acetyltransferase [Burkholderia pseudomallei]|nr:putative acetyltransferase [Burkholderia pseudomallei]
MTAAATAPGGAVTLRGERAGDAAALARVIVAAFADEPQGGQFERRIVDALRADGRLSVSLVAVRDGRLVGHVAFSPVAIGAGGEGWHGLAPLAVWPGCQRQASARRSCARGSMPCGAPARAVASCSASPPITRASASGRPATSCFRRLRPTL